MVEVLQHAHRRRARPGGGSGTPAGVWAIVIAEEEAEGTGNEWLSVDHMDLSC